uniref:DUF4293 domain-containing protein n=1 Tax=Roseihalotalea indica TaxID=2867963 RepID=A0AA49JJV8_9BACT|nr:DUF4293 domain-containing protein [Tunicatimonas sp. TK19036]
MLQRVQSIFLLGVAICMGSLLMVNIWEETLIEQDKVLVLDAYALESVTLTSEIGEPNQEQSAWPIAVLATLAVATAFFEIFRYHNRLLQIKLGLLNSLLIGGALAAIVYFSFEGEELSANTVQGEYEIGIYLPAVAMLLNLLANRFIRRDEQLVRSADRLR